MKRLGKVQQQIMDTLGRGGFIHYKTGVRHGRTSMTAFQSWTLRSARGRKIRDLARRDFDALVVRGLIALPGTLRGPDLFSPPIDLKISANGVLTDLQVQA